MQNQRELVIGTPYLIQFNLLKKCPLRCSYCYLRNQPDTHLPLRAIKRFLDNFAKYYNGNRLTLDINLTGGDLWFHPEISQVFSYLNSVSYIKNVSLLINTLWHRDSKKNILKLKTKINLIQFNIDLLGSRVQDLIFCKKEGIPTSIKIMLAKGRELIKQIRLAKELVAIKPDLYISVDRLCPQNTKDKGFILSLEELKNILENLTTEFPKFITDDPLVRTILNKTPSRSTTGDGDVLSGCIVPSGGLAVYPDGSIKLCSRIPNFNTGFNINNFDLIKYISKFDFINKLRRQCSDCNFFTTCHGGCLATSYVPNQGLSRDIHCLNQN